MSFDFPKGNVYAVVGYRIDWKSENRFEFECVAGLEDVGWLLRYFIEYLLWWFVRWNYGRILFRIIP